MIERLPLFAFLMVALILAPSAVAAGGFAIQADMVTSGIHAAENARLAGSLVAFLQEQGRTTGGADPGFALHAASLRVETDSADVSVHATGTPKYVNPATQTRSYGESDLTGTANRAGYLWDVVAVAGPVPRIEASCQEGFASQTSAIVRLPLVNPQRNATTIAASDGVDWEACSANAAVRVSGNFRLSLWEWDSTLVSGGQTQDVRTGAQPSPALPSSAPDASGVVGRDVEVFFFVTNGTLTVPRLAGLGHTILTGAGTALASSSIELRSATGQIDVAGTVASLQHSTVQVSGNPTAAISGRGTDAPMAVRLGGAADSVNVDGKPMAATVAPEGSRLASSFTIVVLVGLAVVAAVSWHERPIVYYLWQRSRGEPTGFTPATTRRHRRGAGFWVLASRAEHRKKLRKARGYNDRALKLFPSSVDAQVLQAIIAHKQGHYQASYGLFTRVYQLLPAGREQAELACLCAQAAMAQRQHGDALTWLRQAARDYFPTFRMEADQPIYDGLEGDGWFRTMREVGLTGLAPPAVPHDPAIV